MKKIYTLISLAVLGTLALSTQAYAQITLTSADMPTVGSKAVNGHDTLTSSVGKLLPGPAGSTTWNFSSLPTSYRDTNAFVAPSATPYSVFFPGANLADSTYGQPGYTYFNGSVSSFLVVGTEQSIQGYMVPIAFTPPITELNFTAHYGDVSNGKTSSVIPAFGISYLIYDSVKGSVNVTYNDTIDAYGNITTPLYASTYPSLRQKTYELNIDSLWIHSVTTKTWAFFQAQVTKTYQYTWYTNGIGQVLAAMQMDTANKKVTGFQWYDGFPDGINELTQQHNTVVYPNPCSTQITFRYSAQNAQYIAVYDVTGRQLSQAEIKNGNAVLNTSAYSSGIYLYHITDASGNVLDNGKFSVL